MTTSTMPGISQGGIWGYSPATVDETWDQATHAPSSGSVIPLTTKGDVLGFDTAANRVPVGTNGQILTADSAQALGLKWAAPAAAIPPVDGKVATAGTVVFRSGVTGDAQAGRIVITAAGQVSWGDGTLVTDVDILRSGAASLRCTGQFKSDTEVWGRQADGTNRVIMGSIGPGNEGGILCGTDGTVAFYRSAAGIGFFSCNLQMTEAKNIVLGTVTGTKIGTSALQKLGFFNAAPVVQVGAIAAPTAPGVVYAQAEAAAMKTAVDAIRAALTTLGLTA